MNNIFKLKLISPDGIKYEAEATEVTLPAADGQITILPNHMPLVTLLKPGEIIIKNGSKTEELITEGGVAEIANNTITILADTAEPAHSIDELKIMEAKKNAEERLANAKDQIEFADAAAALEKQLAVLSIITKRKKKYR